MGVANWALATSVGRSRGSIPIQAGRPAVTLDGKEFEFWADSVTQTALPRRRTSADQNCRCGGLLRPTRSLERGSLFDRLKKLPVGGVGREQRDEGGGLKLVSIGRVRKVAGIERPLQKSQSLLDAPVDESLAVFCGGRGVPPLPLRRRECKGRQDRTRRGQAIPSPRPGVRRRRRRGQGLPSRTRRSHTSIADFARSGDANEIAFSKSPAMPVTSP